MQWVRPVKLMLTRINSVGVTYLQVCFRYHLFLSITVISIALVVVAMAISAVIYCGSSGGISVVSSGIIRDGNSDCIREWHGSDGQ